MNMEKALSLAPESPVTIHDTYELIGLMIEEIKSRKYPFRTGKAYIDIVREFLNSGKDAEEFLNLCSKRSGKERESAYYALKLFYEKVVPNFKIAI